VLQPSLQGAQHRILLGAVARAGARGRRRRSEHVLFVLGVPLGVGVRGGCVCVGVGGGEAWSCSSAGVAGVAGGGGGVGVGVDVSVVGFLHGLPAKEKREREMRRGREGGVKVTDKRKRSTESLTHSLTH
jgi:hypothetical protein